jgi:RIO kinase 1
VHTNRTTDPLDMFDDEAQRSTKPPSSKAPMARMRPRRKASYEASEEVQRWLREQAAERVDVKPPFNPTALVHQRDSVWVLSSLERFYEEDLLADVLHVVKSGKEATVYCCAGGPTAGVQYVAAKVYRPRMLRTLKNDADYRQSRAQLDSAGHGVRNDRRWRAHQHSTRGQSERVAAWITYEFRMQQLLYEAGADVPRALSQIGNGLLMDFVGTAEDAEAAAPLLQAVDLPREEAGPLFERTLRNIALFLACHCIHGDLSAYNILYRGGEVAPIAIIDFAQAVDPRYSGNVYPLLARDVERVCRYFARYGVAADASQIASDLWERYLHGEL